MKKGLGKGIVFMITLGILIMFSISFIRAEKDSLCFNNMQDILDKKIEIGDSSSGLRILSPHSYGSYDNNRIRLDIVSEEKCNLEYFDMVLNDFPLCGFELEKPFKPLCRNCYEYNNSLSFKNGIHYLNVRCSDKKDISSEIVFFVDRNLLKITGIEQKNNEFINGNDFSVNYNERLVTSATLSVREVCKTPGLCKTREFYSVCELGKNECSFNDLDLSEFNGKEIEYKYIVYNLAGKSSESKLYRAFVDTHPPMIKSFSYSINKNRVSFNLDFDEDNPAKIEYIDYHSMNPVWKTLCDFEQSTNCNPSIGVSKGEHFFDIRVTDKARNIGKYIKVSKNNEAVLGNETAPVTIVMFGDYNDINTKEFFDEIYPKIQEKYFDNARVNLVFRNYPDENNEISMLDSIAVECVRRLSGNEAFVKMHNLVLNNQENISEERLIELASTLTNSTDISDCIELRETMDIVEKDILDGKDAGVFKTPTFFVNKETIIGNEGFDYWKKILNKEYSDCKKGNCWTIK